MGLLSEEKKDWATMHFKGVWFQNEKEEFPRDTIIGSSNFSDRSFFLDFEVQYFVTTMSKEFQKNTLREFEEIEKFSNDDIYQMV